MSTKPENLSPLSARKIRHTLSTGLSFIDTSVNNLSGNKADHLQARKLYAVGVAKLRAALADLDTASAPVSEAKTLGYNATLEEVFTSDNALVTEWTTKFQEYVKAANIFSEFEAALVDPLERAKVVGSLWYAFSSFMPWFLCQACVMVSTNEKRHYVIQTAFEELGMRNSREIHADMFWNAATLAGVSDTTRNTINEMPLARSALDSLKSDLLGYKSDDEILGILLGLEIPAIENIETLMQSLTHNSDVSKFLDHHKFFRLHRQIEIEHVRLTVANFLRFCPTEAQQKRFIFGFSDGLKFWKIFWDGAAQICLASAGRGAE